MREFFGPRYTPNACRFIAAGFFLKIIPFVVEFIIAIRRGLAALETRTVVLAALAGTDAVIEAADAVLFSLEQGIEPIFHGRIVDRCIVVQLIAGLRNLYVERIGPASEFASPFKVRVIAQVGLSGSAFTSG